ncbi:MAG: monovalent cation/H(+) antiporter subunit G [Albimonas sp.]|uniref:monovalent cation/H(+) antiporter subunit G n=1 Tax=Albimonas sp. TaxID=1872425 RepID=UPI004055B647|tara:strand:+ start:3878 stop:4336 length:459 start_codon:yes stop_codon:yes gene_type:complete
MTATITGLLVLAGGVFALLGGLGMLRLPDVLIRMHASTKIGTLASALTLLGAAAHFGTAEVWIRAVAIILFLFLTAPIAAHMVGRAAYLTRVPLWNTRDEAASPRPEASPTEAPSRQMDPPDAGALRPSPRARAAPGREPEREAQESAQDLP